MIPTGHTGGYHYILFLSCKANAQKQVCSAALTSLQNWESRWRRGFQPSIRLSESEKPSIYRASKPGWKGPFKQYSKWQVGS